MVSKDFKNKLKREKLKTALRFLSLNASNIHEENKLLAAYAIEDLISKEKVLSDLEDYTGVIRRFETIFDDIKDNFTIMKEEPFGPIVPILSFKDFDEVMERANDNDLGLCSYV